VVVVECVGAACALCFGARLVVVETAGCVEVCVTLGAVVVPAPVAAVAVLERDVLAPHAAIPSDARRGITRAVIDRRPSCCKSTPWAVSSSANRLRILVRGGRANRPLPAPLRLRHAAELASRGSNELLVTPGPNRSALWGGVLGEQKGPRDESLRDRHDRVFGRTCRAAARRMSERPTPRTGWA